MEGDDQINKLLGLQAPSPTDTFENEKELVVYPRHQLLLIAKRCGKQKPESMASLDTWYGTTGKQNNQQHVEDPAIASIGPPGSRRGGGFGEGFGFGGGIGGRNIGRGGRNIGLRRQPDAPTLDANGLPIDNRSYAVGQMGRFSVRPNPAMRLGGDEPKRERRKEEEWRSREPHAPRDRNNNYRDNRNSHDNNYSNRDNRDRRPQYPPDDDGIEPAWMDDEAPADPAIVESSDPLIKFIPGEDMIAANRPGLKTRDTGGGWRADSGGFGGGGLPAFFGGVDPAIASSSAPTSLGGPPPGLGGLKPKSFNAADYLMQSKEVVDDDGGEEEDQSPAQPQPSTAFTSRFQKFFASPSPGQPSGPVLGSSSVPALNHSAGLGASQGQGPIPAHRPVAQSEVDAKSPADSKDDRMAKLMGLLTTKATPPESSPAYESPRHDFRHISSPPESAHSQIPPHLHAQAQAHTTHLNAHSPGPTPSVSPNFYSPNGGPAAAAAGGRPSSHPNALLQQLYGSDRPMPSDPLQLLAQAQAQGQAQRQPQQLQQQSRPQQQPQAHMSLPPQFARPPPPPQLYPEDNFSPYGHGQGPSPFPNANGPGSALSQGQGHGHPPPPIPPPGYLPPPHFYQGPPRPQMPMGYPGPGPGVGVGPAPGFPPQQGLQPGPRQFPLGPGPGPAGHGGAQHQQDMLATLFAGLGPRN
ncbi:hypothetical protein I316_02509 [Kwoniella heveanensis BCC8398]|uniref:Uncharacterized protein n=1 Tax=Kwoniella heveanensis BCC8398 TaxID=1296120 RepID=A0A1B9GY87_9TREE|nr:hypothetical protein I316_02509 [Kwoniella heveanensis BCC8398]